MTTQTPPLPRLLFVGCGELDSVKLDKREQRDGAKYGLAAVRSTPARPHGKPPLINPASAPLRSVIVAS